MLVDARTGLVAPRMAAWLRRRAKNCGLSVRTIASVALLERSHLSHVLHGKARMGPQVAARLLCLLGDETGLGEPWGLS